MQIAFEKYRIRIIRFPPSGRLQWIDDSAIENKKSINTIRRDFCDLCRGAQSSIFLFSPFGVISQIRGIPEDYVQAAISAIVGIRTILARRNERPLNGRNARTLPAWIRTYRALLR
jgi:hypothetical protein